jgi:hypothetical protein
MLPSSKLYYILAPVRSVISEVSVRIAGFIMLLTSCAGLFYNRRYLVKLDKTTCFLMGLFCASFRMLLHLQLICTSS